MGPWESVPATPRGSGLGIRAQDCVSSGGLMRRPDAFMRHPTHFCVTMRIMRNRPRPWAGASATRAYRPADADRPRPLTLGLRCVCHRWRRPHSQRACRDGDGQPL
jgi:hypothetical protein